MRHPPSTRPRDAGAGLPELLVTMALFAVLASAVGGVFIAATSSVRTATTKNATTADARLAMEVLSRTARVAVRPTGQPSALVEARQDALVLFASLDRGAGQDTSTPTRVSFTHDAATGCLNETQVLAQANTASDAATNPLVWPGAGTTRCLIRTTTAPTFDYFDVGTLHDPATGAPAARIEVPATGLDVLARLRVVSVQVSLTVTDPQAPDVAGVVARDRVTLTNVLAERSPVGVS